MINILQIVSDFSQLTDNLDYDLYTFPFYHMLIFPVGMCPMVSHFAICHFYIFFYRRLVHHY
jgi:hypothetical protein